MRMKLAFAAGAALFATILIPVTSPAQMLPGEPPKGALRCKECIVIKVDNARCKSGKMRVCGACSIEHGKRSRTCI